MLHKINSFLWDQPNIDFRIFVVRVAVGLLTVSFVLLGPFDRFHVDGAGLLYRPVGPFRFIPAMGAGTFFTLKYTVVVSAIAWAAGYKTRIANAVFAISYFVLAYYAASFSTQLFSYITHLNLFSIILCFVDTSRFWSIDRLLDPALQDRAYSRAQQEFASFALAFMQLYVIAFYLQAGGSKLLIGGRDWFLTGATPYYATIVAGTRPGLALTRYPWIYVGVSLFTGLFEFGFFLVLVKRLRPLFAAGVLCFHFGILLNINICFYQLSGLVPLLFWFQDTRDYRWAVRRLAAYLVLLAALVAMTPLDARPLGTSERDGAQLELDLASSH